MNIIINGGARYIGPATIYLLLKKKIKLIIINRLIYKQDNISPKISFFFKSYILDLNSVKKILILMNQKKFYGVTKKSHEIMVYSYSSICEINYLVLTFSRLHGSHRRTDIAIFKFIDAILNNKKIQLFTNYNYSGNFTCIYTFLLLIKKIILRSVNNEVS